jgi:hypothetical protein
MSFLFGIISIKSHTGLAVDGVFQCPQQIKLNAAFMSCKLLLEMCGLQ